ncbi:hypothetical protein [Sphingopyxis kveilinensis]|uniref:hypothetical protein n=1 Tax=Sphingopyxis kveilinensis TaxID=3114367 RepID=UPI0030CC328E
MNDKVKQGLAGMPVNERLSLVWIIDRWDEAVRQRDRKMMMALLEQVEVSDPHLIVDAVLTVPKNYGF